MFVNSKLLAVQWFYKLIIDQEPIKVFIVVILLAILSNFLYVLKFIKPFLMSLFVKNKLEIQYFNVSKSNVNNQNIKVEDEIWYNESIIYFHWKVKGSIYVKILPNRKLITGNMSKAILTKENRKFILVARGLFMSKSAEIEIPEGNIIISDLREYSRQLPVSYVLEVITDYLKYSKLFRLGLFQKISDKINISKRIVKNSLKLNTSFIRKNFNKSSKIGLNISQNRSSIKYNQLNYTFSTSKYNEILKKPKIK